MYIDYCKLWKLLIEKEITKTDLMELTGISSRVMAKLSKNETVTTETIARICTVLNCDVSDIMECVNEDELSIYSAFKKIGKCVDRNERYKTIHFSINNRQFIVYESIKAATRNTHIECRENGTIYWTQWYPVGHVSLVPETDVLIKPERGNQETVIVLIKGKPSIIIGLDEHGFVSSRNTPTKPTDIYVMSEAAFKLFSLPNTN